MVSKKKSRSPKQAAEKSEAASDGGQATLCSADLAEAFLRHHEYGQGPDSHLRYWHGDFWRWTGRHYEQIPNYELQSDITAFLQERDGERGRRPPTKALVQPSRI